MVRQSSSFTKTLLAVFVLAGLATLAIAQKPAEETVKFPDTPSGKTVAAFFKAFNSGDLETMKKFHQEYGGSVENADKDKGFYDQSGGLKVHSVTRSDKNEIEVLVQAKSDGRWLSLVFTVAEEAPHGIRAIRAQPASAPNEKGNR